MENIEILSCGKCHSDVLRQQEICHRCGAKASEFDSRYFWIKKPKGKE